MNTELTEKLYTEFPHIFRERNMSPMDTCMCWGICCADGWFDIIYDLCKKLKLIQEVSGLEVVAIQVKEKFGCLRFYYGIHTTNPDSNGELWARIIHDVVMKAEGASSSTCEKCGKPGKLKNIKGWYTTICNKCSGDSKSVEEAHADMQLGG